MMQDSIKKLIGRTVKLEGDNGVIYEHPEDRGGKTKFGVAYNFHYDFLAKNYGINSSEEMSKLTLENAYDLYYKRFYLPIRADIFGEFPEFQHLYFDCAVNCSTATSIRLLQKMLNALSPASGTDKELIVDGILGPKTIEQIYSVFEPVNRALCTIDPDEHLTEDVLCDAYKAYRTLHYIGVYQRKLNKRFLNSWLRRV